MSRVTLDSRDLRSHSVARTYTQPTFCTTTKKKVREKIIIIKVRGKIRGKRTGKNTGKKYGKKSRDFWFRLFRSSMRNGQILWILLK